ncbi:MAG: sulfite exporter TauE/SafE family protein [Synergistaceae bacterium]|jgi:sulfite exporter TauE/SafE/copper chaperone CopZ|nr:sulfite exporter TauE/SafE family protein [Synergistaceae bacterium]
MSRKFMTKTLRIADMTCTSCENRIERKLRGMDGVANVKASFAEGSVQVTYDAAVADVDAIAKLIETLDYHVVKDGQKSPKFDLLKTIWVAIALYELYAILDRFELLDVFYAFPEAKAGMGYGMLFLIGALTSVHCVAMCGGINLSQSLATFKAEIYGGRLAALRPGFLYNLGRVASYTLIGGLVGALGSVVSLSGNARGWVQAAAGAFMVIMGLNMLNVFPWLRRLNPRMPKVFADKIHGRKRNGPLYVGLLNGLMPCGPLQAMQLYALSTGSVVRGSLSMFLFSVGTVPLMFGLSALSTILSKKFTRGMMTVGATMVVILGIAMFGNGMNLSGISASLPVFAQNRPSLQGAVAQVEGGVQVVETELASGRYAPITVQAGIPVRWTIHANPGTLNGCNNRIIIPEYGRMQKKLELGDNVVEFTPTRSGTFLYTCWMGMIRGKITVLDKSGEVEAEEVDENALAAQLPSDLFSDVADDSDPFDMFDDAGSADAEPTANAPSCCALRAAPSRASLSLGPRRVQTRRNCCGR